MTGGSDGGGKKKPFRRVVFFPHRGGQTIGFFPPIPRIENNPGQTDINPIPRLFPDPACRSEYRRRVPRGGTTSGPPPRRDADPSALWLGVVKTKPGNGAGGSAPALASSADDAEKTTRGRTQGIRRLFLPGKTKPEKRIAMKNPSCGTRRGLPFSLCRSAAVHRRPRSARSRCARQDFTSAVIPLTIAGSRRSWLVLSPS